MVRKLRFDMLQGMHPKYNWELWKSPVSGVSSCRLKEGWGWDSWHFYDVPTRASRRLGDLTLPHFPLSKLSALPGYFSSYQEIKVSLPLSEKSCWRRDLYSKKIAGVFLTLCACTAALIKFKAQRRPPPPQRNMWSKKLYTLRCRSWRSFWLWTYS